ncbi:site-specific integrase [Nocardiopsis kunsanensis]|uniref:Site-specific integrase n=1 Tax=Nocardiopsis kunsanensis TaxID=141693 RepID=A0A918XAV7_9ACTN|nr:tyrosine-type recombinase/integrase [Nocardiopsis kunsanensis]GHD23362.1 site-specific integrase [Nocardiopsis kunsanensis]
MPYSNDIDIYRLARKKRRRGHGVRWVVAGREFSKWFTTEALADNERSMLKQAAKKGESFCTETGQPESVAREMKALTVYDLACEYTDLKWAKAAAKTRQGTSEALAILVPALVKSTRGMPDPQLLRDSLYQWAFHSERRQAGPPPGEFESPLTWIRAASLKVTDLDAPGRRSELIRKALDALATRTDGRPAAAKTVARKRAALSGLLNYAVERDIFPASPLTKVKWDLPKASDQVDRRRLPGPALLRRLLDTALVERPDLAAFYGCAYYAMMRPGEIVALTRESCASLPKEGWGLLSFEGSSPRAGSGWTDSGETHDKRQLKHRAEREVRNVPIPPKLVALLQRHLDEHVDPGQSHLFRGKRGGPLSESTYGRVWQQIRKRVLSPGQFERGLAGRVYDLRAAGITVGLNGGVPVPELAQRAGHSPAVLLRVYAGCLDGDETLWNARLEAAFEGLAPISSKTGQTPDFGL